MRRDKSAVRVLFAVISRTKLLSVAVCLTVCGAVIAALLPPLVLENMINRLSVGQNPAFSLVLLYFALTMLANLFDMAREGLLTIFGQKITRGLRHALCAKQSRLPADYFTKQEPGAVVSRFVGDVDTVEALFTSGIISMFADACKVVSIFVIIFIKNRGLALVLLIVVPFIFWFTRVVQQKMLAAQLANRAAVAKVNSHVPETLRCIRTIHNLRKEHYMREKYDRHIQESYAAVEKTNFYDAVYSPVILIVNALVVAAVMLLSASGNAKLQAFFGMSVGTAVAVINYISQVFSPLESIGMEIQTIQSAVAGLHRIDEFLNLPERFLPEEAPENRTGAGNREQTEKDSGVVTGGAAASLPCIEFRNVTFGYEVGTKVLENLSFTVERGGQVTLAGRTGAGKSTIFKLLLGLYQPEQGEVLVYGRNAAQLSDEQRSRLFGYVEQSFYMVPGTVLEQITLFREFITEEQAREAAAAVGLENAILRLERGYDTPCTPSMFSQGQWQLLSIARAVAAKPEILLLDEITANLDSDTEAAVLAALQNASTNRTVLSISHRLYEQAGMRVLPIGTKDMENR